MYLRPVSGSLCFAAAGALCLSPLGLLCQQNCPLTPQAHAATTTYPTFAAGQTTYIVPLSEANQIIDTLSIPSGDTIKAGAGVTCIQWTVSTLSFGAGATIDLSPVPSGTYQPDGKRSPRVHVKQSVQKKIVQHGPRIRAIVKSQAGANGTYPSGDGADGSDPPPQAIECAFGDPGAAGGNGAAGAPGVELIIHGITSVDNDGGQGLLWIQTDGGPGGDGGNGGRGEQGGGQKKFWSSPMDHCSAQRGGGGGAGGQGGPGGSVATVSVTFTNGSSAVQTTGTAATCAPSHPQPASPGTIVVWGAVGCPGVNGQPGPDGSGG
jgi:hypothetical protein